MSLVGNLEDLSLGDLLQIVSLSQKSGVLVLGSAGGAGQIVFRSGLVHAAGVKGRTPDLRRLLIGAGLLDGARFDAVRAAVGHCAVLRPDLVVERTGLDHDQVDAVIRKTAEAAIFEMFAWDSGEFSFDVRSDGESEEPYPCLRSGINAQYLAMEGMRLRDERARALPAREVEVDDDLFFGAEPLEVDGDEELELDRIWVSDPPAQSAESAPPVPSAAPEPVGDSDRQAAQVVAERVVLLTDLEEPSDPPTTDVEARNRPVVVIDREAAALEWVKSALEGRFARIHVFQRAEEGLARIRQYLIRGEAPIVLIAPSAPIDPLSGIHGVSDFAKRLRAQAARIVVVGLREAVEGRTAAVPGHFDAVVQRPAREKLRPGAAPESTMLRERLLAELAAILARPERGKHAPLRPPPRHPVSARRPGRRG